MSTLHIQQADPAHIDELCELFLAYLRFYEKTVAPEAAKQFLIDRLQNHQSVIFLATLDGEAVGFVQLYPSFASLSLAPSWILNDLYVNENARGQGVAQALMQAARQLAEDTGAVEIFLQTARSNTAAQRLYQRLGYVRDDHYLVYTLNLPRT